MKFYVTSEKIVLFWDFDFFQNNDSKYIVYVNDILKNETMKNHFTINGLLPNTKYKIKVVAQSLNDPMFKKEYECSVSTSISKKKIDITKAPYFAIGDGKKLNTESLQKALDDCTQNDCVYIPKGTYLTGSLSLHSNTELYLEEGAVIQGSENPADYLPFINSRFEGIEMKCYSSLLNMGKLDSRNGANCENILIHGKGNIFGGGRELAENIIALEKAKPEYADLCTKEKYDDDEVLAGRIRPRLINISNCRNIILDGLTVGYGPSWNIHMIYSENIVTANCTIVSKGVWNGDGWNPDSSTNCTIFNCIFETGDDCIAIKSGKNPEGNIINRPCKGIRIFDCKCLEGFGGIAIGSEMSGGIENVKVWDCDFAKVRHGLQIKATKKRGGYVRNIIVKKTIIPCILLHSVWYNDDGIAAPTAPIFEDCLFENIDITGKAYVKPAAKTFEGIPDEVDYCSIDIAGFDSEEYAARNIKFKDIRIKQIGENSQKIMLKFSQGITFENISCK